MLVEAAVADFICVHLDEGDMVPVLHAYVAESHLGGVLVGCLVWFCKLIHVWEKWKGVDEHEIFVEGSIAEVKLDDTCARQWLCSALCFVANVVVRGPAYNTLSVKTILGECRSTAVQDHGVKTSPVYTRRPRCRLAGVLRLIWVLVSLDSLLKDCDLLLTSGQARKQRASHSSKSSDDRTG